MQAKVHAPGLAKLRRDLRRIDKEAARKLDGEIRELAKEVREEARRRAPELTGRLKRSYRYSLRRGAASVYSDLEYSAVHEFGGTIRPKGVEIEIKKSAPVYGALAAKASDVEERLGDAIEAIAGANGFNDNP